MTDQAPQADKAPTTVPGLTKAQELRALMYCGGLDPETEAAIEAKGLNAPLHRTLATFARAGLAEDAVAGCPTLYTLTAAGLERLDALGLPTMPARVIAATARQGSADCTDRAEDQAAQDEHARKWLTAWGSYTGIHRVDRDELRDRTLASRIWNRRLHRLLAQRQLWAQVTTVTGLLLAERDADLRTGNLHSDDALTCLDETELIRSTYMGDESAAWELGGLLGVDVPADLREQKERIVATVRERLIRHGLGFDVDAELGPAVEGIRAKLAERDVLAAQADLSLAQRDEARRERGLAEAERDAALERAEKVAAGAARSIGEHDALVARLELTRGELREMTAEHDVAVKERDAALTREAKALLDRQAHRSVALEMTRERDRAVVEREQAVADFRRVVDERNRAAADHANSAELDKAIVDRARKELADERAEVARLRAELKRIEDERRADQAERDMRGDK